MKELFEKFLMHFCFAGIGAVSVVAFVWALYHAADQTVKAVPDKARKSGVVATVFVVTFAFGMILHGGGKNNSPSNDPPAQMQMSVASAVAGVARPAQLVGEIAHSGRGIGTGVFPGEHSQFVGSPSPILSNAHERVEEWWRRGAMSNGHVVAFDADWRFPYGTNHLTSVEIWGSGAVYSSLKDPNPIAELFTKLSLAPHDSEVFVGRTTNNSYRVEWHGGHPNRDLNLTADASIELFRNGDWCVTENGVAQSGQRVLPFPHDGFGQDDEWVTANFTNASEILAVGYPQWVDQQVGEGLTNGLYKFIAEFLVDPPETVQLVVGDLSVAVTNAGTYVFLLEKGIEYSFGTECPIPGIEYSMSDDLLSEPISAPRSGGSSETWTWSVDGGWSRLLEPEGLFDGSVLMMPTLRGVPDVGHIYPEDFPVTFTAVLSDCAHPDEVAYEWTSDDDVWDIATPHQATTAVSPRSTPNYATAGLSVTATIRNRTLTSSLSGVSYGTNSFPSAGLSVRYPSVTFLNDDYRADRVYPLDVVVSSDVPTSGVVTVTHSGGDDHLIYTNAALTGSLKNFNMTFGAYGATKCASNRFYVISRHVGAGAFSASCRFADGGVLATNASYNVIEPICRLVTDEEGPDGRYVNPSRIVYGTNAWLSVSVNGNYSPNDVRWAITPQTGRITERRGYMVKVEPTASSGTVVVEARFNSDPHQPRFEMPIVQRRTIPVRAFVVKVPNGKNQIPNSRVVDTVEYANKIYEQVGIRFDLLSITRDAGTTNDWVLAEYDVDPMTGATNRNQISAQAITLMNSYTNHNCVELYFVGMITNNNAAAFRSVPGIAVSQKATLHVVAHEIGHALGLQDCYNYSDVNSGTTKDFSKIDISKWCFTSQIRDWGSALGRGFYAKSDMYALVQQSFLMYGRDGKVSVDIPDGAVLSISNKATSVSSAYHVPVGASAIKQNNSEVYSQ